jgi:HAD superfamily hydrolase (TIGR01509 family)
MRPATTVQAVLLDMDGTLVDSNDAHARAWVEALAEEGFTIPFARIRHLIGMGSDALLPEVTGLAKDTPRGQQLSNRWGEIFRERYLRDLRPFPHARDLVARMRAEGLRIIVASSSEQEMLDALLELVGITTLIGGATSASDTAHSKPAPDLVAAALAKAELPPAAAVMLGDTPYDIEAARKADVRTIALRCGGFSDADLTGALALYDDPAALLARYDTSPLGAKFAAGAR